MTKRSSGTHAAWHFWFAVSFGGESGPRKLGLCGIRPLTRRYATLLIMSKCLYNFKVKSVTGKLVAK
ncbi:DUF3265 domain-containing protein [Vibrio furnissii]|nr:DUF3265 domain-containing protein [Vibrio furnissii]UON51191.1 DUF3265 domain-containing protein [Vibrio furnissii]